MSAMLVAAGVGLVGLLFLWGCLSGEVSYVDVDTGEKSPYSGPWLDLVCPDPWYPEASVAVPVDHGEGVTTHTLSLFGLLG